jgi:hypothetical protein
MRRVVAILAVLVVSCGQSSTAHTAASTSRLLSPSSPSPSLPQTVPVDFSCRLPVMTDVLKGDWVTFPGGGFSPDPASQFTYDQGTGTFQSTQQPKLTGSVPLLFYDRPQKRWLPTPRSAVYPDGSSYAYVTSTMNPTVHLVDVASGRERTFAAPRPVGAEVFDYGPDGVYLAGTMESGVWLLNAQTGAERLLTSEKVVWAVANGKVWFGKLTTTNSSSVYPDTLVELNLSRGDETVWFHRDNQVINLLGLTSDGEPVVSVQITTGEEVWVLRSPAGAEKMYSGPRIVDYPPVSDAHGIWLGSGTAGIYLFTSVVGTRLVSVTRGAPAGICA